jgi:hypothetical protein
MRVVIAEKKLIPHPKNYHSTLDRRALAKHNQGLGFCIDRNGQTSFTAITRQLTVGFDQVDQRDF